MIADIPQAARLVVRLIPADDREWVVGDLLEDADARGLRGIRLNYWLAGECSVIGAGLAFERLREACRMPLREIAVGLGRHGHSSSKAGVLIDTCVVTGTIAVLVVGAEMLMRTLFVAAGF